MPKNAFFPYMYLMFWSAMATTSVKSNWVDLKQTTMCGVKILARIEETRRQTIFQPCLFRSDNFETSLTTLLQLGTSALKVGMSAVGDQGAGQFASKVGVASGDKDTQLTSEEILHKQQV